MKELIYILIIFLLLIGSSFLVKAQDVNFFTEGTDNSFYDQGIVDVNNLGESTFEFTYPPGFPQYNDKVPCSINAFKGATSLKFNYKSSENGNWKASIFRNDWSSADISGLDSLSFYIYSDNVFPKEALPLIGLKAIKKDGSEELSSKMLKLADFNDTIPAAKWTKVSFPLDSIFENSDNNELDFTRTKAVIFNQSESDNSSKQILIDEIKTYIVLDVIPAVEELKAKGYDSHAELNWKYSSLKLLHRIYASFNYGETYELRGETDDNYYLDFVPENGKNKSVKYKVISVLNDIESESVEKTVEIKDFTDDELIDMVQEYSFRYFWEGAHPETGMALERTKDDNQVVASGATGMGLMAMIVAYEREYRPREEIKDRVLSILDFLKTCERYHGAWSHWYFANTTKTKPFTQKDDGGDLVETSYVAAGLIALKNYFTESDDKSIQIREKADLLWKEIDWSWYRRGGQNSLSWHWSPTYNFDMNMLVSGWNEALVVHVLAASSPTHNVPKEVYTQGWANNGDISNKRRFYNYNISLSPNWGGPLFWLHYSHLGINPHGLKDEFADYWTEHVNTAKIHYEYAIDNPGGYTNYSEKCWGLTASDDPDGYTAHSPLTNDNGTISPTGALASFPYTPEESLKALKYFYRERGADLFGRFGPFDAFNDSRNWVKKSYIGIDQGPIVVMIENHRTGLIWNAFMKDADVKAGLDKLGFEYIISSLSKKTSYENEFKIYPNPTKEIIHFILPESNKNKSSVFKIFSLNGQLVAQKKLAQFNSEYSFDCSKIQNGMYMVCLEIDKKQYFNKLVIKK